MIKRLLGALALACALFSGAASAQQFPATAQNTMGQNRDVVLGFNVPTAGAVKSFVQTCTISAAALAANTYTNGYVVTALSTNTGTVYIGGSGVDTSANGYPLIAGQSIAYGAANSNQAYIICTNPTDKVAVTGN